MKSASSPNKVNINIEGLEYKKIINSAKLLSAERRAAEENKKPKGLIANFMSWWRK